MPNSTATQPHKNSNRLTVLDIATMGLMVAMLEAVKRALDGLPNVELVTFLLIMFTLFYGWKTIFVTFAFTAIETAFWGIQVWVIMYLYMWPLLVCIVLVAERYFQSVMRKQSPPPSSGNEQSDAGKDSQPAPLKTQGENEYKRPGVYFYSIVSAAYGLSFGALCAIPYLFIGGPAMAFSWWVAGIPFDIIHCISNFLLCLILFQPVYKAFTYASRYIGGQQNQ